MGDPKKIFESRDIEAAALYAKQVASDAGDLFPVLVDADGNLRVNMTVGTVSLSSTASVITNAVGNPVNVSVTNTVVTIGGGSVAATVSSTSITASTTITGTVTSNVVNGATTLNVNVATATLGTVTITGTVTPSTTASTITNAAANPVQVTGNVNVATATLGTVTITGTVTPSTTASTITNAAGNPVNVSLTSTAVSISTAVTYSTVVYNSKTITTGTGSFTSTNNAITLTPTNRAKVFAISLTTTSATELICVFNSGGVANGVELWRATLMAPAGASAGLNLAVTPPAFLFQSRSGTAVSLSLNTATLVHYSVSYFDEAS